MLGNLKFDQFHSVKVRQTEENQQSVTEILFSS